MCEFSNQPKETHIIPEAKELVPEKMKKWFIVKGNQLRNHDRVF